MTTETDSLGSFKNSFIFFPQVGAEIFFQAYEGLEGGRQLTQGPQLRALVRPTPSPLPRGADYQVCR